MQVSPAKDGWRSRITLALEMGGFRGEEPKRGDGAEAELGIEAFGHGRGMQNAHVIARLMRRSQAFDGEPPGEAQPSRFWPGDHTIKPGDARGAVQHALRDWRAITERQPTAHFGRRGSHLKY